MIIQKLQIELKVSRIVIENNDDLTRNFMRAI